jgi:hypothetical protein
MEKGKQASGPDERCRSRPSSRGPGGAPSPAGAAAIARAAGAAAGAGAPAATERMDCDDIPLSDEGDELERQLAVMQERSLDSPGPTSGVDDDDMCMGGERAGWQVGAGGARRVPAGGRPCSV